VVETWPQAFDTAFGYGLGMRSDADFASIVRQYMQEFPARAA